MTTATMSVETALANDSVANPHGLEDGRAVAIDSEDVSGDPLALSGAIKASAVDMARYMITQSTGGLSPNGTRVVSAENLWQTWRSLLQLDGEPDDALGREIGEAGPVILTNIDDIGEFLDIAKATFVDFAYSEF
jgi:hypothetical protein